MIAVIIQARMGSRRLPNKVLMKVKGVPLLEYQIKRVKNSKLIDEIIVATTILPQDDQIVAFCKERDIPYFRGAENDVLGRYYECAKKWNVDTVVRLTADCPLSDPKVIDDVIALYNDAHTDYAANTIPPETSKYPDGSDVEVFSINALERAYKEAKDAHDREHVTFYFWKYDNDFKTEQLKNNKDYSKYRITVDYPEDFEVIEYVINEISKKKIFGDIEEIIAIIDANQAIKQKNSQFSFGIGWKQ